MLVNLTPVMGGSSPHTRGALAVTKAALPLWGIIPAYAGSTKTSRSAAYTPRDHPRIRGEHSSRASLADWRSGSSPHTRGALAAGAGVAQGGRIIPAYAGSTGGDESVLAIVWDHPRIRGEHIRKYPPWPSRRGSSPHTRGALTSDTTSESAGPDHPRIRGEHASGLSLCFGW